MKLIKTIFVFLLAFNWLNVNAQDTLTEVQLNSLRTELKLKLESNCRIYLRENSNSTSYVPIKINSINITLDKIEFISDIDTLNSYFYEDFRLTRSPDSSIGWIQVSDLWFRNDLYAMDISAEKGSDEFYSEISKSNKEIEQFFDLIQQLRLNYFHHNINSFRKDAEIFLGLLDKPIISENQRKSIVQANSLNEAKDYSDALSLYEKAIKINQFAYPSAYYNMALIAAQLSDYNYAIFNMKKYLILEPNAPDARAAQDKIYEWELNIN